jgi:hypothetical protein
LPDHLPPDSLTLTPGASYAYAPLLTAAILLSVHLAAHADTVTDVISFSADNGPTGSFTLTFDPTLTYIDQTTGLTLDSFSSFASPIPSGFLYFPTTAPNGVSLILYGLDDGEYLDEAADDYELYIDIPLTGVPGFGQFVVSTPPTPSRFTKLAPSP